MTQCFTRGRAAIILNSNPISKGGEGTVFSIVNKPGYCVKIFHSTQIADDKKAKIEYIINNSSIISPNQKIRICWPTDLVFDKNQQFIGFIMPLAFDNSILLYEIVTLKLSSKLSHIWNFKFDRATSIGLENRLKICVNIAIAIHVLHQSKQFVLVDFKPQNILITEDGKISLIDLDSLQISHNNKVLFNAKVVTPEYAPKESEKLNPVNNFIPESWDNFSLAIIFYELLFGIHPFASTSGGQYEKYTTISEKINKNLFVHGSKKNYLVKIPKPHENYSKIPTELQKLFIKAFEDSTSNPNLRPSADEWGSLLVDIIKNKSSNIQSSFSQPTTFQTNSPKYIRIVSNPSGASVLNSKNQKIGITPFMINKNDFIGESLQIIYENQNKKIYLDGTSDEITLQFLTNSPTISPPILPQTKQKNSSVTSYIILIVFFSIIYYFLFWHSSNNHNQVITSLPTTDTTTTATTYSTTAVDTATYNEFGEGNGMFMFWTSYSNSTSISIQIDDETKGTTTKYFDRTPSCSDEGTLSIILTKGKHTFKAIDENGITWEGNIEVEEGMCRSIQLTYTQSEEVPEQQNTATKGVKDNNDMTPEELCKVFLGAFNKADCTNAWNATLNPAWEAKGRDWFCSCSAFGGIYNTEITDIFEIPSNIRGRATVTIKYFSKDRCNSDGYFKQYFETELDKDGFWRIVKIRNM